MGLNNIKFETEVFQFQAGPFQFPGITPVETKADPATISQIVSQISQLTVAINQIGQAVVGQAFTRAAPVVEAGGLGEEIRKLSVRLDGIESRLQGK